MSVASVTRRWSLAATVTVMVVAANVLAAVAYTELASGEEVASGRKLGASSNSRVLLLRNGRVLTGQVSYEGDFYRVTLPTGEIRVRGTEVEHVCRTFGEVYERKREAIAPDDFIAQLRLADWCVRHNLFAEADTLIVAAERLAPTHARVRLARRSLQMAQNPDRTAPKVPTLEKISTYNRSELDTMTRAMPEGTVETFRRSIQPMLLSGCVAARCHGSAATNDFRLIRPVRGQLLSRRATQRNLQAVLRRIDPKNVGESQILSMAYKPHATVAEPLFVENDAARYRQLAEWVALVVEPAVDSPPVNVGARRVALSQAVDRSDNRSDGRGDSRRVLLPGETGPGGLRAQDEPMAEIDDPWDPEIFNRRYHRNRSRRSD